jgi:serine/threonine-protein kinase HipA
MASIRRIFVKLDLEGNSYDVGELVLSDHRIYFRYDDQFVQNGFNLSPINLPFNNEIQMAKYEPFEGIHGLFNDSFPDSWGKVLLDRTLSSNGINISNISPLDRLAYVGKNGVGALIYQPEMRIKSTLDHNIDLDVLAAQSNKFIEGRSTDILDDLFLLGGSSGGTRPKVFVAYNAVNDHLLFHQSELSGAYEHWIVKFPSSLDHPEIAKIEYAYYLMARKAGLKMEYSKLLHGKSGQLYFATKRFDRIKDQRLHMHSASGLLHDNYIHSQMDYGHLMDLAFKLEKHIKAYEKVFRLAAFNLFAHNRNDHSKNFSFLMDKDGKWQFAPAYDLIYSSSSYGFHSTMFAGESQNPTSEHLLKLAHHFGLKNGEMIIEEVKSAVANWAKIAEELDITKSTIQNIDAVISKLLSN